MDNTGPEIPIEGQLAFAPVFSSALAGVVDVESAQIVLTRLADSTIVTDTTVSIEGDSVDLAFTVVVLSSPALFTIEMSITAPDGAVVFQAGPDTVLATTGTSGNVIPAPVSLDYVGPGSDAATFAILTSDTTLFSGETLVVIAEARDSSGAITPAPVVWTSTDSAIATVDKVTGVVVAGTTPGTVGIVGELLTDVPPETLSLTVRPLPSTMTVASGDGQVGGANATLPSPVVFHLSGTGGFPVPGLSVSFAPSAGTISQPSGVTDAGGNVSVNWTMPATTGSVTLAATVDNFPTIQATATATVTAGAATDLTVIGGNGQTGTVGSPLMDSLVVEATDLFGNPVPGTAVNWSVTANDGTVNPIPSVTGTNGRTSVEWTLGTAVGTNEVVAALPGVPIIAAAKADSGTTNRGTAGTNAAPSVTFTATGQPASAFAIAKTAGDIQVDTVGATLSFPLVAQVTDLFGNPVSGTSVTFAVTSGGGSLTVTSTTSDASGFVQTFWTLGTATGVQSVSVTSGGLAGSPLSFTATATAGVPVDLAFTAQPSPTVNGATITPPIQVSVLDGFGNVVTTSTVAVDITIGANPGGGTLSGTTTAVAANGVATFPNLSIDLVGSGYTLLASSTGLTTATSSSFDITLPPGVVTWVSAVSGNWSAGTNWSSGVAPTALDTVLIAVAGTYTVTLDVDATVADLTIGGASGTQTFSASGRTLTAGNIAIGANVAVSLVGASLAAPVSNAGSLLVQGGSSITGTLTTGAGSFIQITGRSAGGNGSLTVSSGFVNTETIELTTLNSTWQSQLVVSSGTLINLGTIRALPGTGGVRRLDAQIDNQGLLDIQHPLTIVNTGTTLTTDAGTLSVASGQTLTVNGGATIVGTGTSQTGPGTVNLTGTQTMTVATDLTLGTGGLNWTLGGTVSTITIDGPGTMTNVGTLPLSGDVLNADLVNTGTVRVTGNSAINGAVTTGTGAVLEILGSSAGGNGILTVATGFTNSETIQLTTINSTWSATLNVTAGPLVNTGTITSLAGTGGLRTINSGITNTGTLDIQHPLTIVNTGTTLTTDAGTLNVASGQTLTVQSGTTVVGTGTAQTGTGTVNLTGTHTMTVATDVTLGTGGLNWSFGGTVAIDGPGVLTNVGTLPLSGDVLNAALVNTGTVRVTGNSAINGAVTTGTGAVLEILGSSAGGNGILTVATGFTNSETIQLTTINSSWSATLNVTTGPLMNTGTITSLPGTGGLRTINSGITNTGTLDIQHPLTIVNTGTTLTTDAGTLNVASGQTLTVQSGTTVVGTGTAQTGTGTVNLTGTHTMTVATDVTLGTGGLNWSFGGTVAINGPGVVTNVGTLPLSGDVLNAALVNTGTVRVTGNSAINGAVTTGTGAVLEILGSSAGGNGILTVATGFTNAETIQLTSINSSWSATMNVTAGTLLNTGSISSLVGNAGNRTIDAAIDNQGTLDIQHPLTIVNTGTTLTTDAGTLDVAGGQTLTVQSGTTIIGTSTAQTGTGTVNLAGTHTLTVATAATFNSANLAWAFGGTVTVNGPGVLTNAGALTMSGDIITADLVNNGTLTARGNSQINGAITTGTGSAVRVQGSSSGGNGILTIANGFTNSETIELTSINSSWSATMNVTTGPLVNTGTISSLVGNTGIRTINAGLDNQAVLDVQQPLTFNGVLTHGQGAAIQGVANLTLSGTPTLAGDVNPGTSPGILDLSAGAITMGSTSNINIELDGTTVGTQYDRLDFNGDATWTGNLVVTFGFTPTAGDKFAILTVSGQRQVGPFANVPLPVIGGLTIDTLFVVDASFPDTMYVVVTGPAPNTWDGDTDASWSNVGNWSNGNMPDGSTDVVIPSGTPFTPQVSFGTVRDLTIAPGATLELIDGSLNVLGDLDAGNTITGFGTVDMQGIGTTVQGTLGGSAISLQVTGDVTLAADASVSDAVFITGAGASLNLGGFQLTVAQGFNTASGGQLVMDNIGILDVGGPIVFDGTQSVGSLTAGVISARGNFSVGTSSQALNPSGTHLVNFVGTAPQQVTFFNPSNAAQHFQHVQFSNATGGVLLTGGVHANGNATVIAGTLDLGNNTFGVDGNFTTAVSGIVALLQSTTQLDIEGNAEFGGGSTAGWINDGIIRVAGDFLQTGGDTEAFHPSGANLVVMDGTTPQTISILNTGIGQGLPVSHFAGLALETNNTVTLATDVFGHNDLASSVSFIPTVIGNGNTLAFGGMNVDDAVMDRVRLEYNGMPLFPALGAFTQFDGVTFQNYAPADTQMRFVHEGDANPFTLNSPVFDLVAASPGLYFWAADSSVGGPVLTVDIAGATPGDGSAFTGTEGGALVNWGGTPAPTATWTGAGDATSWGDGNNWNPIGIPSATDSIIIDIGTSPTITMNTSRTIRWLQVIPSAGIVTFTIFSQTLTVDSLAFFSPNTVLDLGGDIRVNTDGVFSNLGTVNWTSGTLTGTGTSGFVFDGPVGVSGASQKTMDAAQVVVNGTMTWTGGNIRGLNSAAISIGGTGLLDIQVDASFFDGDGTGVVLANLGGAIRKTAGNATTGLPDLLNAGVLDIQTGTVSVQDFAHPFGAVLEGTGTLQFATSTPVDGAIMPGGAGVVGTLNIVGDLTFGSLGQLTIDATNVLAPAWDRLNVTGSFTRAGTVSFNNVGIGQGFQLDIVNMTGTDSGTFTSTSGWTVTPAPSGGTIFATVP